MKRYDILWILIFCGVTAILVIPASRTIFTELTTAHPYGMGFLKFALMASMGELASVRILGGKWKVPAAFPVKVIIWGLIGMLIVLMFQIFTQGINGTVQAGYLPLPGGWIGILLKAFLISTTMNLTFGPMFMAAHRISDTFLDSRSAGAGANLGPVISRIDWAEFIRFVVGRTIPMFWIPAHTITFLLPAEFRVIYAAYLSIALGAILAYARRRKGQGV